MGETKEKVTIVFGADGTPLESGLSGIKRRTQRAGDEIKKSLHFKGERAQETAVRNFVGGLASAKTGADVAEAAVSSFAGTLRGSIALMAGIEFGVKEWEIYTERVDKARQAMLEINKIGAVSSIPGQSADAVKSQMDEETKIFEDFRKDLVTQNPLSNFLDTGGAGLSWLTQGGSLTNPKGPTSGRTKEQEAMLAAAKENNRLADQQTDRMKDQLSIAWAMENGDQKAVRAQQQKIHGEEAIADIKAHAAATPGVTVEQMDRQVIVQRLINAAQEVALSRTEEQAQAQRDLGISGMQAAAGIARAQETGNEAQAKYDAESQRYQEAKLKISQDLANVLITGRQSETALQAQRDIFESTNAIIEREQKIRQATLDTETAIANLTGKASSKKLTALRDELALQQQIQATTKDVVVQQEAANKAVGLRNQIAEGEIAQRRQTGVQRAQETRDAHALERQLRIDAARAARAKAKTTDAFGDFFHPRVPAAIQKPPAPPVNAALDAAQLMADAVQNALQGNLIVAQLA